MIYSKQEIGENSLDAELAEKIKEDLVSTLRKKGIRVVDMDVNISRDSASIQIQGKGIF